MIRFVLIKYPLNWHPEYDRELFLNTVKVSREMCFESIDEAIKDAVGIQFSAVSFLKIEMNESDFGKPLPQLNILRREDRNPGILDDLNPNSGYPTLRRLMAENPRVINSGASRYYDLTPEQILFKSNASRQIPENAIENVYIWNGKSGPSMRIVCQDEKCMMQLIDHFLKIFNYKDPHTLKLEGVVKQDTQFFDKGNRTLAIFVHPDAFTFFIDPKFDIQPKGKFTNAALRPPLRVPGAGSREEGSDVGGTAASAATSAYVTPKKY